MKWLAEIYKLKLIPKLKTKKSLKLLLVDMKSNSRILMRLEMAGMTQRKQKCLIFKGVAQVRVKKANLVQLVSH